MSLKAHQYIHIFFLFLFVIFCHFSNIVNGQEQVISPNVVMEENDNSPEQNSINNQITDIKNEENKSEEQKQDNIEPKLETNTNQSQNENNSEQNQENNTQSPKVKIFDTVEFKRPLNSLPAWLELIKKNSADPIFIPEKQFNKQMTWQKLKDGAKNKDGLELLRYINTFWNTWPYKEDQANWGKPDYWATPSEFLKKSGDCEDYSIIKYFTLKELGIPAENMRIVILRDTIRNLAHAVLVVYLGNDAYILDNLSNAVLSHTRFKHYSPQYSVNEFGRWAHLKGRKIK